MPAGSGNPFSKLGMMETRTLRILTGADVAKIADAYHAWRETGGRYADEPGRLILVNLPRRARAVAGNQKPWPADKVERWSIDRLIPYAKNARRRSPR